MALLQRSQVGVREFGRTVTVPNDPRAKLMYYLSCVCTVLDLQRVPRRLINFSTSYNLLGEDEITELIALCMLFSPDILTGRVIFEDTTSNGSTNNFLELSSVQSSMLVTENVVIGGESRRVAKVMTFTQAWLRKYYEQPMREVLSRQIGGGYQNAPTVRLGAPPRRQALPAPSRPNYGSYNYRPLSTPAPRESCCCCVIL